ncbi:hypothetical protein GLX27_003433 [Malassezia furfur]|uniref:Transmembrane protein 188 n=1 Tax=Malassezia furfur TaxID=55194 RepID=A0ABY8ET91_MALFU|nr:hypothetical protein GLX27_003433 [Malassezia furfur]
MLFLFFASGIYADRITAAKNFVPQANRALWTFNMYLNMRTVSRPPRWLAPLLFWRKTAAPPSATPSHIPNENDTASLGPRRLFQRRTPIQPVPPTHNERGEILFSSRVHASFRDGYERYRNAFERKRKEKLEAQRRSRPSWFTYLWSTPAKPAPPASEKEAERHAKAT